MFSQEYGGVVRRARWIQEMDFDKEHQTPYGYGSVSSAGRLNVKLMLDKFKERLVSNQRWIEEPFVDNEITLVENGVEWRGKFYNRVVFCRGHKELDGRWFKEARIQANKGELLDLVLPKSRITSIINNGKFLIPLGGQNYRLGATYGRNQRDTTPTQEAKELLLDKMKEFLPEDVKMKEHLVGIRPTVTDRKPIIGWRDDDKRICIFNGLGTRGVLNAPYTASCFIRGLFDGEPIPEELDFMRFVW